MALGSLMFIRLCRRTRGWVLRGNILPNIGVFRIPQRLKDLRARMVARIARLFLVRRTLPVNLKGSELSGSSIP